ncbi:hypothetical protein V8E53_002592 [Lactarius tabidus]
MAASIVAVSWDEIYRDDALVGFKPRRQIWKLPSSLSGFVNPVAHDRQHSTLSDAPCELNGHSESVTLVRAERKQDSTQETGHPSSSPKPHKAGSTSENSNPKSEPYQALEELTSVTSSNTGEASGSAPLKITETPLPGTGSIGEATAPLNNTDTDYQYCHPDHFTQRMQTLVTVPLTRVLVASIAYQRPLSCRLNHSKSWSSLVCALSKWIGSETLESLSNFFFRYARSGELSPAACHYSARGRTGHSIYA